LLFAGQLAALKNYGWVETDGRETSQEVRPVVGFIGVDAAWQDLLT
jgi:hypothetical protein